MKQKHLFQPLMRRFPDHGHDKYYIIEGHSQDLLQKIRDLLDVLAPIGDDHQLGFWIEVPRGKPLRLGNFQGGEGLGGGCENP